MSSRQDRKPDRPTRGLGASGTERNYQLRRTQSQHIPTSSSRRAQSQPLSSLGSSRRPVHGSSSSKNRSQKGDESDDSDEIKPQSPRRVSTVGTSRGNAKRPVDNSAHDEISPVSVRAESGTSSSYPYDKFACRYDGCTNFTDDVLPCEFCPSHCCHLYADHPKIPTMKCFAHEPQNQSTSRQCQYLRCTSTKLKTCRFFCMRHCCSKRHGQWDRLVTKSNRRSNRKKDWEDTHEYK